PGRGGRPGRLRRTIRRAAGATPAPSAARGYRRTSNSMSVSWSVPVAPATGASVAEIVPAIRAGVSVRIVSVPTSRLVPPHPPADPIRCTLTRRTGTPGASGPDPGPSTGPKEMVTEYRSLAALIPARVSGFPAATTVAAFHGLPSITPDTRLPSCSAVAGVNPGFLGTLKRPSPTVIDPPPPSARVASN